MALGTMEPPVNHLPPPPPCTPLSVALCVLGHCTTYKKKKKANRGPCALALPSATAGFILSAQLRLLCSPRLPSLDAIAPFL